jgi:tetratricopeptide (TPR) repeat protein
MDGNKDLNALYDQAMVAIKANRLDEAKDLLSKVVSADPNNEQAWFWLADVHSDLKQTIYCLQQVIALNPNNTKARDSLSFAMAALEETEKAPPPAPEPEDADRPVARLGRYLLHHQLISTAQLEAALRAQDAAARAGKPRKMGDILVEQGAITRERLNAAVREQEHDFFDLFQD